MSIWSRIGNVLRGDGFSREIDEELRSHIEEAIARGRDPEEARRSFGSSLRRHEESRDLRLLPWLDSLRADAIFGWRQIVKRKVTSAAAILSLALAIGACTSAFRLIDAVLLRPLPVANPERLYVVTREGLGPDGKPAAYDGWAYPAFQLMRAAVKDQAELLAVSYADRVELTDGSDQELEKPYVQYVSGWMFGCFGLRPAIGRLFTENDDRTPGAHPYAVLSYDYWSRRFGQDSKVLGRTFRMGDQLYEIAGVSQAPFTGTEPGTVTDVFIPIMMHPGATHSDWTWHRTLVRLNAGVAPEPVGAKLHAVSRAFEEGRAHGFSGWTRKNLDRVLAQRVVLLPAPTGASDLQQNYRRALAALAVLVGLVLLIACANVANLLSAKAAARAREMALRVSIGAGRMRLVQLVLMESALLAFLAAAMGGVFAWWSAPFVVSRINPPDNPARLDLPADWRVLGFAVALTIGVTFLFGLLPALRASAVKPASALKGGHDSTGAPHSRSHLMNALIAVQVAFCFLVLFVAGLFAATFDRLAKQSNGFSADRLLTLEVVARPAQAVVFWDQLADRLRAAPGVESVAMAGFPLMGGNAQNTFIAVNGGPPFESLSYLLSVSPGWLDTMKIPLLDGRDFRPSDTVSGVGSASGRGVALVNQAFAKEYFQGENPVGKSFERAGSHRALEIVGLVGNARYRNVREPMTATAYLPLHYGVPKEEANRMTFLVRTMGPNPLALASMLRQEVPRERSEFRVANIRTQLEINRSHMVRERLLSMLAAFFAVVALMLAGIGLYGVLDYSVLQRRREIGIRMAIGAGAGDITRRVTGEVFAMVLVGAGVGLGLGMASARYIEALLYEVRPTDLGMLVAPSVVIVATALLASLPAVSRAVRIDPVAMLRAD